VVALTPLLAVVLAGVAAAGFGCKGKSSTPGTQPAEAAEEVSIELSDPKVTLTDPQSCRYEVRYRFAKGQPKPDAWYDCHIEFEPSQGVGRLPVSGKEMKTQGSLTNQIRFFKLAPPELSFAIVIREGPSNDGPFHLVSNKVTGKVQR